MSRAAAKKCIMGTGSCIYLLSIVIAQNGAWVKMRAKSLPREVGRGFCI
ncbi:hypothetical protein HMPREF9166_1750 [Selenomonas sp. oral taxon 149 str. 67H29BP]|nr:hypothetical protein HMPREF9166_1750 [Selenomonas sp. oral taxon 149 str. 67H29BP]